MPSVHLPPWLLIPLVVALYAAFIIRAVVRPNREPASRVAWVMVILLAPAVGMFAYLLLGETSIGRARKKRLADAEAHVPMPNDESFAPPGLSSRDRMLFALGRSINGFRAVAGNRFELMADSNAAIASIVSDIGQARDHVHVSFYIWLDDHNGETVVEALVAAARRGVTCRAMVDAIGSRAFVKSERWRQLADAGVKVVAALGEKSRWMRPFRGGRIDLRNHRKIVVIDNRISYCGSQNCADPEFRVKPKFAPWVDMLLRCEGPVVRQEQHLFVTSWMAETDEDVGALPGARNSAPAATPGVVAQMVGTGPTTRANAMSEMFVAAMFSARKELIITTPYFVPNDAMLLALCSVPRRGVKTTMIFPARIDSRLVGFACRSTYSDLLDAGVDIWEYPLGLLHTKSLTIDGEVALVGSANMDRRSLDLNYENNVIISDRSTTRDIRDRQEEYRRQSLRVSRDAIDNWSIQRRFVQNAVAMLAPIL